MSNPSRLLGLVAVVVPCLRVYLSKDLSASALNMGRSHE